MKLLSSFLLLMLLALSCKSPKVVTQISDTENKTNFLDSLVRELIKPFPENTQISIGVVNKNKQEHFGFIKKDSLVNTINNKHTLFQIGSITKVFTGVLLGDAINSGIIKLTDSLEALLPYAFKNGGSITIQDLTTHTSGIYSYPLGFQSADGYEANDPYNHVTEEMIKLFFEDNFISQNEPGEKFEYSNLGVGLLAHIIANKNSLGLMDTYQKVILNPLGMNETCMENCTAQLAIGLDNKGAETPSWHLPEIMAGAGALLSNSHDMCKFISAVAINQFPAIENSKTPLFRINESTEMCMNWFYADIKEYGHWYFHGGGTGGFTSAMFLDDETDNGIIVLSNVSAFHPDFQNIEKIAMEYLKYVNKN